MAARKRPKSASPKLGRQPTQDPKQRLIEAALTLAAEQGWRRTGMAEIAAAAGVPLKDAYAMVQAPSAASSRRSAARSTRRCWPPGPLPATRHER